MVQIAGAGNRQAFAHEPSMFQGYARYQSCQPGSEAVQYAWSIDLCLSAACLEVTPAGIALSDRTEANLQIPAGTLIAGNRYKLRLTVGVDGWTEGGSYAIVILEVTGTVAKCIVQGGAAMKSTSPVSPIQLSVLHSGFTSPVIRWECIKQPAHACLTATSDLPLSLDAGDFAILEPRLLPQGRYQFTADVSDQGGNSTVRCGTILEMGPSKTTAAVVATAPFLEPVDSSDFVRLSASVVLPEGAVGLARWYVVSPVDVAIGNSGDVGRLTSNEQLLQLGHLILDHRSVANPISHPVSGTASETRLVLRPGALTAGVTYKFAVVVSLNDEKWGRASTYSDLTVRASERASGEFIIENVERALMVPARLAAVDWVDASGSPDVEHYFAIRYAKVK